MLGTVTCTVPLSRVSAVAVSESSDALENCEDGGVEGCRSTRIAKRTNKSGDSGVGGKKAKRG